MSQRLRRFALVLAVGGIVAATGTPVASAHVGELKSRVEVGPYRLVVAALPAPLTGVSVLNFRASLEDRRTGSAIESARIRVFVREPSGRIAGPYRASDFGGVVYLLVPIPNPDTWRQLRFRLDVDGPLGAASGVYTPPNLWSQWLIEPYVFAAAAAALGLFLQGFVRLRRRGRRDHASWGRLVLFGLGLGLMVGALVSPVDVVGDSFLLSVHMLQHVLIGDAGPALIVVALRGPLVFFMLPPPILRLASRWKWLRTLVGWLVRPKIAVALWAVAYGGWHVPVAYDYAATHQDVHDVEHASFVVAGFLIWTVLVDPTRHRHLSRGVRLATAATVFAIGTVISDVLIFSPRALYTLYAHQAERVFELSPLHDQQLAGLAMTVDQVLTLGIFTAIVLWPALRTPGHRTALARLGQPA